MIIALTTVDFEHLRNNQSYYWRLGYLDARETPLITPDMTDEIEALSQEDRLDYYKGRELGNLVLLSLLPSLARKVKFDEWRPKLRVQRGLMVEGINLMLEKEGGD